MNTIFLSKILGVYFIIISIAYLINPHRCKKVIHEITKSYAFTVLCGSIGIIIGTLIILNHNIWTDYLEMFISLIGWLIFIIGFIFIFFPKFAHHVGKKMHKHHNWIWVNLILLIIGIFLTYIGFIKY